MHNLGVAMTIIFVVLLLLNVIKIIYELHQANDELAHKYLKYSVVLLSTLTIGSYVVTSDLNKALNENQKEIYEINLRADKESNDIVKERLLLLKDNKDIISKMPQKLNFSYYLLNILGFSILLIMMFVEKKSLTKTVGQNKNQKFPNHRR